MPVYSRKLTKGILWFYKFNIQTKMYRSRAIYPTKQEAKEAEVEAYKEAMHRQKHPHQLQEIKLLQAINERLDYVKARKSKSYYNDNRRY